MTKALSDAELEHLLNFIGYGRLDADIWFLGIEEAGGGEANIRTRLKFRPVKDNAEAHKMLGVTHLHRGKRPSRSSPPGNMNTITFGRTARWAT